MNLDSGVVNICPRHPSQTITGFCSSCLTEKLSTVSSVFESNRDDVSACEITGKEEDRPTAPADVASTSSGSRVRITLSYLFQLDDKVKNECVTDKCSEADVSSTSSVTLPYLSRENGSRDIFQNKNDKSCKTETSSEVENASSGSGTSNAPTKSSYLGDKGIPTWIGSIFSRSMFRSVTLPKKSLRRGSETDQSTRHSSVQKLPSYSDKKSSEDPRHLFNGMMAKESSWSPAVLRNRDHKNTSPVQGNKRSFVEERTPAQSSLNFYTDRVDTTTDASMEGFDSADRGHIIESKRGSYHEGNQQANNATKLKKPLGCGKSWYRSITNPWKDIFSKHGSPFHRSLSASWGDDRKWRNSTPSRADAGDKFQAPSISSVERQHETLRSSSNMNSNGHRVQSDSQSKDLRVSRSRSLHYSSSGNVENGLLRFYLTPLGSSRGFAGRRKSGTLAGGISRL